MNPSGLLLGFVVVVVATVLALVVGRRLRRGGTRLSPLGRTLAITGVLLLGVVTVMTYYALDGLEWMAREAAKERSDLGLAAAANLDDVRNVIVGMVLLGLCWVGVAFEVGRARGARRGQNEPEVSSTA